MHNQFKLETRDCPRAVRIFFKSTRFTFQVTDDALTYQPLDAICWVNYVRLYPMNACKCKMNKAGKRGHSISGKFLEHLRQTHNFTHTSPYVAVTHVYRSIYRY